MVRRSKPAPRFQKPSSADPGRYIPPFLVAVSPSAAFQATLAVPIQLQASYDEPTLTREVSDLSSDASEALECAVRATPQDGQIEPVAEHPVAEQAPEEVPAGATDKNRAADPVVTEPATPEKPSSSAGGVSSPARLWGVTELGAYLDRSRRWIFERLRRDLTAPGSIPHARVGRGARFDPAVIQAWVRRGMPPAAEMDMSREV